MRIKRKSSGKNTNVTLQKMVIAIPADMQDGENYDPARLRAWADDVGRLLEEDYGELLIDIDVHVDEVPNRLLSSSRLRRLLCPVLWTDSWKATE